jgi:hypothetical protein
LWLLFLPAMHGRDFGKRWVLYPESIRESLLGWSGEAPREVKWGLALSPELQSSATPCSRSWDVCRAGFSLSTLCAHGVSLPVAECTRDVGNWAASFSRCLAGVRVVGTSPQPPYRPVRSGRSPKNLVVARIRSDSVAIASGSTEARRLLVSPPVARLDVALDHVPLSPTARVPPPGFGIVLRE